MDCREVRELAESYLSEELLVETTHKVLGHLDVCPACRTDLVVRQELRAAVRRAFAADPALQPTDDFRRAIPDRLRSRAVPAFSRPRAATRWAAAVMAFAAAAVVFFLSGGDLLALARDAAGDHRDCAVQFKLPEQPISLDAAADRYDVVFRRLDEAPPAQLATAGGPIRVVDRHSCIFEGRRFAHIVLDYQGHTISLLVTGEKRLRIGDGRSAGPPDLTWLAPIEGFTVASFNAAAHTVFVVGDLDRSGLRPVAEALLASVFRPLAGT